MSKPPIGYALAAMNSVASSEWIDKLGLRNAIEKLTYQGTKTGFQALGAATRQFKNVNKQLNPTRLDKPKGQSDLFDLSITDEQQMMKDTVQRFAQDIVRGVDQIRLQNLHALTEMSAHSRSTLLPLRSRHQRTECT